MVSIVLLRSSSNKKVTKSLKKEILECADGKRNPNTKVIGNYLLSFTIMMLILQNIVVNMTDQSMSLSRMALFV